MTSISGSSIFVPLGLQPIVPVEPIPTDDTSNQSAPRDDDETTRAAAVAQQVKAFEAYLNQTTTAQAQSHGNAPATDAPQSTDAASQSDSGEPTNHSSDQQGLLTDVTAFEAYLNGRAFAATQDPIANTSSIPIPIYQTTKGTLNPLPVTGPEQTTKTADTQSHDDKDKRSDNQDSFLDTEAIANLVANQKSVRYDPVHDLESRSIYKPPGETTPL